MTILLQTPAKNSLYSFCNKYNELTTFILNEINNQMYFRVITLRRRYIRESLNVNVEIPKNINRSVSMIIAKIVSNLAKLGLVERYSKFVWKNLYKYELICELDKLIKNNENRIKKFES